MLTVSRSGFYNFVRRGRSKRDQANGQLLEQIYQLHQQSGQTYGSPRMTQALRECGHGCNHKRVARLMRINGIRSKRRRRFKVTTFSGHNRPVVENLVKRNFTAAAPNQLWTSDITYIRTDQGWLYLAVFLDVCSRRIVGWSMHRRISDNLIIDAFTQACTHRRPQPGLVVHSDRGSQYCSLSFKELLGSNQYVQSMSSTGNCYDNAITESFFATLKTELVRDQRYQSHNEARRSIFKFIEMFYNRQRIHSALGGMPPDRFEQKFNLT